MFWRVQNSQILMQVNLHRICELCTLVIQKTLDKMQVQACHLIQRVISKHINLR